MIEKMLQAVEDLLVEFDEMDFVPLNPPPGRDPVEVAKAWKELLIKTLMEASLPAGDKQDDIHREAVRVSCLYMRQAIEARARVRALADKVRELEDTLERREYEDGKRLQMQIDPFVGVDRHQIDTLERSFAVPQGLIESDRIRDFEVFAALKEMVQELARRIEIRCEDIENGKYQKVTLLLRVVCCPSSASTLPEDYLKRMVPRIVRLSDVDLDVKHDEYVYGGPRDGGKNIEELHRLSREVTREILSGGGE